MELCESFADEKYKFSVQSEVLHYLRLLLPIFMGIYFQNKTLVT